MGMKRLCYLVFLLSSFRAVYGQTETYISSRPFESMSFTGLVQFVESESKLRFYYKDVWISDVFLTINDHSPLLPQVSQQLSMSTFKESASAEVHTVALPGPGRQG